MTDNPFESPQTGWEDVPAPPEPGGPLLAGRGTRLAAAIVDGLIMMLLFLPIYFWLFFTNFLSAAGGPATGNQPPLAAQEPGIVFTIGMSLLGLAVYLLLHGYLLATNGQTIAKRLFGIKIVRTDGSRATFGRIVGLRLLPMWFIGLIPFLGRLVAGLVDPLLIFRANRHCLHDDIADTVVVRDIR